MIKYYKIYGYILQLVFANGIDFIKEIIVEFLF